MKLSNVFYRRILAGERQHEREHGGEHLFLHFSICVCVCVCVSSLRRGHANLLCIVPISMNDPRREYSGGGEHLLAAAVVHREQTQP